MGFHSLRKIWTFFSAYRAKSQGGIRSKYKCQRCRFERCPIVPLLRWWGCRAFLPGAGGVSSHRAMAAAASPPCGPNAPHSWEPGSALSWVVLEGLFWRTFIQMHRPFYSDGLKLAPCRPHCPKALETNDPKPDDDHVFFPLGASSPGSLLFDSHLKTSTPWSSWVVQTLGWH